MCERFRMYLGMLLINLHRFLGLAYWTLWSRSRQGASNTHLQFFDRKNKMSLLTWCDIWILNHEFINIYLTPVMFSLIKKLFIDCLNCLIDIITKCIDVLYYKENIITYTNVYTYWSPMGLKIRILCYKHLR